jgi:hypothetical protein
MGASIISATNASCASTSFGYVGEGEPCRFGNSVVGAREVGTHVGRGVGLGVGLGVGAEVGEGEGSGVGEGEGSGVGEGVGENDGR